LGKFGLCAGKKGMSVEDTPSKEKGQVGRGLYGSKESTDFSLLNIFYSIAYYSVSALSTGAAFLLFATALRGFGLFGVCFILLLLSAE